MCKVLLFGNVEAKAKPVKSVTADCFVKIQCTLYEIARQRKIIVTTILCCFRFVYLSAMSFYSFYFDKELIETTIEKIVDPTEPATYKLVMAEKDVTKKLGNPIIITEKDGVLSFKIHQKETNTEYGEQFLDRFRVVLNWCRDKKFFD